MKILFLNSIGKNKFGGGEKWMLSAAKGLADSGHQVIIAGKNNSQLLKCANKSGVSTRAFNIYSDFSPINTIRLARFLKKENVEILVCNLNKDVRVGGLAAKAIKFPAVIARHGVLRDKTWRNKISLRHLVDGILTNTESIKRIYDGYGWFDNGFVKVVYNGIENKSQVRAYDFSRDFPGKKVIFSAGRLTEQKGFADLIHAAALLARQRQDLIFVIAGKGRLENELKHLAQRLRVDDMVRFRGFHENIDPYLKGCDLFVLASHFEGMPNVVMEAMAVGKAVIATDVNGVRELMEPEKTGRIVPPRDPGALARSIGGLIDQQALLQQFGREGLKRVQVCFTIPRMVKNLEDYFSSLLHAK